MTTSVIGSGSWGTALAILLARNGHDVTLHGRSEEEIQILRSTRENMRYLPGFAVPEGVQFEMLDSGAGRPDLTVVAVPSGAVREVVSSIGGDHPFIVICAKGLEATTAKTMVDVVREVRPNATVGVLSGPNLAIEIVRGVPTVAIAACEDRAGGERIQAAFMRATFRVSLSDDVIGIELAGALKNVLAIGAGMSDGLGFGDNTKGAFLSRGLVEMARLGDAMGARLETFLGPAGVGDLFATAVSRLSRNYRVGLSLGKGASLRDTLDEIGQVAEGVPTSEAALVLARRHSVDMPVFGAVEAVIRGRVSARDAVGMLMDRASRMDDFLADQLKNA